MHKYKAINLIYILPFLIFTSAFVYVSLEKSTEMSMAVAEKIVKINKTLIKIEVADDMEEQWQGLSDRKSLDRMSGMLFVFPVFQERTFVMRRMHFPLDIIWIRENRIVKIHKMLSPEGEKPINRYSSIHPVNYVLEVNGGMSDAFGFEVGDRVKIQL